MLRRNEKVAQALSEQVAPSETAPDRACAKRNTAGLRGTGRIRIDSIDRPPRAGRGVTIS